MMKQFAIRSPIDTYSGERNKYFQKHGFGKCRYINNIQYSGYWKNHKKHGKGIIYWENGSYYRGIWNNDICVGKGHYYNAEENTNTYGEWDEKRQQFLKRSERHIQKYLPNKDTVVYPGILKLPKPYIRIHDPKNIIVKPVPIKDNTPMKDYTQINYYIWGLCGTFIGLCIHAFR